jgi:hypothetical protein
MTCFRLVISAAMRRVDEQAKQDADHLIVEQATRDAYN